MCGIAGIFDLRNEREIDRDALQRMSDAMIHRGPDGAGTFFSKGIALAHRRLAIIDLANSTQPFHAQSNQHVLTYNGEIYNYRELSDSLSASGTLLKTNGDTEIIAEGIARKGIDYIHQLRGMFAFGFWDEHRKTLTLARDRLGEKPLYYGVTKDGFLAFASELGALKASGLFSLTHNPHAIADYFMYGYVPDPKSIYEDIHKLEPGHLLTASVDKGITKKPYWQIDFNQDNERSYEKSREELLAILDESVASQMISDVPLGAFLSGGVDSSAIVASMSKHHTISKASAAHQDINDLTTCSIGFDEASHDERPYAQSVANQFHTTHHEEVASLRVAEMIDQIVQCYDEPFADSSALPTWMVSKLARKHVTVALSGDGGDEVFAGYRRYPFYLNESKLRNIIPASIRRPVFGLAGKLYPKLDWAPRPLRFKTTFQALGDDEAGAYARASAIMLPERAHNILSNDFTTTLQGYTPDQVVRDIMGHVQNYDSLSKALYTDMKTWLSGRMLVKTDRASMAHSLEVRPPLLDYKLVEWAAKLPSGYKLGNGVGKRILKDAVSPRLPADLLNRKKQGFGLPVNQWLRTSKDNPLDRLRNSSTWHQSGLIDKAFVEKMISDHQTGRMDYGQELWSVIMFDGFLSAS